MFFSRNLRARKPGVTGAGNFFFAWIAKYCCPPHADLDYIGR
jgi:hypothetical protein